MKRDEEERKSRSLSFTLPGNARFDRSHERLSGFVRTRRNSLDSFRVRFELADILVPLEDENVTRSLVLVAARDRAEPRELCARRADELRIDLSDRKLRGACVRRLVDATHVARAEA